MYIFPHASELRTTVRLFLLCSRISVGFVAYRRMLLGYGGNAIHWGDAHRYSNGNCIFQGMDAIRQMPVDHSEELPIDTWGRSGIRPYSQPLYTETKNP